MPSRAAGWWALLGLAAFAGLPWYFAQGAAAGPAWPPWAAGAEQAPALIQAWRHGRPWLWLVALGLLGCAVAVRSTTGRAQGAGLLAGAGLGLAGLLGGAFLVGPQGWVVESLAAWTGGQPAGQPGLGVGAAVVLLALLVLLGAGWARRGACRGDTFVAASVVVCSALLLLFVAWPVGRSLAAAWLDEAGQVSGAAWLERIASDRVWGLQCLSASVQCGSAWNTLTLALLTATGTTVLGTLIALVAERGSSARLNRGLQVLALLPIITPPFVVGLGLVLLFGRSGLVNQLLEAAFGIAPTRWFYGWPGLWLAQLFAFTPLAFLIMRGVVQGISPSLEEAALTLRASPARVFRTVTLPLLRPGLANAFLLGFVESVADFGNPIVVGGSTAVLSTDIFFAVVGAQYDAGRAAALALVLTGFALVVFGLQRAGLARQGFTTVTGKGDAGIPLPLPAGLRRLARAVVLPWLAFTAAVYLFAFSGGFVRTWGRDPTPTLAHFLTAFDLQWGEHGLVWAGTAWHSLAVTCELAAIASVLSAGLGLLISWLLARTRFPFQRAFEFAALLAFAIPGTVLGVSYVLVFNVPPFELTGTALIIVLCFVFRSLPVGVRAGSAAFEQLDRNLDEASLMLRAGMATTLRRVTLPLLKPAVAAALVYSFVRSMTTVSAVVFLVTAELELATTYIIGRVGNGDVGVALAYCTVLMALMALAIGLIQRVVGHRELGRRSPT